MKIKTSELTGAALDWAVAKAEGRDEVTIRLVCGIAGWAGGDYNGHHTWNGWYPSTDWAQGGPIIERERLGVCYYHEADGWEVPNWAAWRTDIDDRVQITGETALIAAMRCFVASKLGDEVDVPEELMS